MGAYERTQSARWMWLVLIPCGAIIVAVWLAGPSVALNASVSILCLVILACFSVFTRLTIRADADAVTWYFGWGFPGSAIPTNQIERAEVTKTNLFEGWGIHWTIWHGWVWNASGFQAVEIFKTDGGKLTLGTDDPQGLFQAIERFRKGAA
jgi:hypothetical protein